jgi:hypothetical protein
MTKRIQESISIPVGGDCIVSTQDRPPPTFLPVTLVIL